MRIIISTIVFLLFYTTVFAQQHVRGHWKDTDHDGVKDTYIEPYYRTTPDGNAYNNYSTQGNTNPHTGERGHVNPSEDSRRPSNNDYNTRSLYR